MEQQKPYRLPAVPLTGANIPTQPTPQYFPYQGNQASGLDTENDAGRYPYKTGPFLMPSPRNMDATNTTLNNRMTPKQVIEWNHVIQKAPNAVRKNIAHWTLPDPLGAVVANSKYEDGTTPYGVNAEWIRGGTFAPRAHTDADGRPIIAPALWNNTSAMLPTEPLVYVNMDSPFYPLPDQNVVDYTPQYMHPKLTNHRTRQPTFPFNVAQWEGFTNQYTKTKYYFVDLFLAILVFFVFVFAGAYVKKIM